MSEKKETAAGPMPTFTLEASDPTTAGALKNYAKLQSDSGRFEMIMTAQKRFVAWQEKSQKAGEKGGQLAP